MFLESKNGVLNKEASSSTSTQFRGIYEHFHFIKFIIIDKNMFLYFCVDSLIVSEKTLC